MEFSLPLLEHPAMGKLVSSLLLLVAILVGYHFAAVAIRRVEWSSPEVRRGWLVMARNVALLLALVVLAVVWATQLRTLALSLVGFAVAIVLVTKELLMCLTGGILRSSTGMFGIGDRIELKKIRGDVIDMTLFTTTVLEIGPEQLSHQYSGRAVVLPNSLFLAEPLVNESYTGEYVLHMTVVPLLNTDDWRAAERRLLSAANEVCAEFIEAARRHISRVGRREGIDVPAADPRVIVQLSTHEEVNLVLRFPAPARRMGSTEQAVVRRYLDLVQAEGKPAAAP